MQSCTERRGNTALVVKNQLGCSCAEFVTQALEEQAGTNEEQAGTNGVPNDFLSSASMRQRLSGAEYVRVDRRVRIHGFACRKACGSSASNAKMGLSATKLDQDQQ